MHRAPALLLLALAPLLAWAQSPLSAADADAEVFQPVRMTDTDGRAWIALYPMLREADGTWRINGCHLVPAGQEI